MKPQPRFVNRAGEKLEAFLSSLSAGPSASLSVPTQLGPTSCSEGDYHQSGGQGQLLTPVTKNDDAILPDRSHDAASKDNLFGLVPGRDDACRRSNNITGTDETEEGATSDVAVTARDLGARPGLEHELVSGTGAAQTESTEAEEERGKERKKTIRRRKLKQAQSRKKHLTDVHRLLGTCKQKEFVGEGGSRPDHQHPEENQLRGGRVGGCLEETSEEAKSSEKDETKAAAFADLLTFHSKVVLDVGSSTGGFTDCVLQR